MQKKSIFDFLTSRLIYNSTYLDDYLWYIIFRGETKTVQKTNTVPEVLTRSCVQMISGLAVMGRKGRRKTESAAPKIIEPESQNLTSYELKRKIQTAQRAIQKKDIKKMFASPITDAIAPGYSQIIAKCMDFYTINKKVAAESYSTFREYMTDVALVIQNCMSYNMGETPYFKYASKLAPVFEKIFTRELGINFTIKLPPPRTEPILLRDIIPGYESSGEGSEEEQLSESDTQENDEPEKTSTENNVEDDTFKNMTPPTEDSLYESEGVKDAKDERAFEEHLLRQEENLNDSTLQQVDQVQNAEVIRQDADFDAVDDSGRDSNRTNEMLEDSTVDKSNDSGVETNVSEISGVIEPSFEIKVESENRSNIALPLEVDIEQNSDKVSVSSDVSKNSGFSFASSSHQLPSTPTKQRKLLKKRKRNDMYEFVDEEVAEKPLNDIPGKSKLSIEDILNMSSEQGGDADDSVLIGGKPNIQDACSPIAFSDEETHLIVNEDASSTQLENKTAIKCENSASDDLIERTDEEKPETFNNNLTDTNQLLAVVAEIGKEHEEPLSEVETNQSSESKTSQGPETSQVTESIKDVSVTSKYSKEENTFTLPDSIEPGETGEHYLQVQEPVPQIHVHNECNTTETVPSEHGSPPSHEAAVEAKVPVKRKRGRPPKTKDPSYDLSPKKSAKRPKPSGKETMADTSGFHLPDAMDQCPLAMGHPLSELPGCYNEIKHDVGRHLQYEKPQVVLTTDSKSINCSAHVPQTENLCNFGVQSSAGSSSYVQASIPGVVSESQSSGPPNIVNGNLMAYPQQLPSISHLVPPQFSNHDDTRSHSRQIRISPSNSSSQMCNIESQIADISPSILTFTPSTAVNFESSPSATKYFDDLFVTPVKSTDNLQLLASNSRICSSNPATNFVPPAFAEHNSEDSSTQFRSPKELIPVTKIACKRSASLFPDEALNKKTSKTELHGDAANLEDQPTPGSQQAPYVQVQIKNRSYKVSRATPLAGSVENPLGYLKNGGLRGQINFLPRTPCAEKRINVPKDFLASKTQSSQQYQRLTETSGLGKYSYLNYGPYGHTAPDGESSKKSETNQMHLDLLHSVYSGTVGLQFAESLKTFTSGMNGYMKGVVNEFLDSFTDGKHSLYENCQFLSLPYDDEERLTISEKELKLLKSLKKQGIDLPFLDETHRESAHIISKCVDSVINLKATSEKPTTKIDNCRTSELSLSNNPPCEKHPSHAVKTVEGETKSSELFDHEAQSCKPDTVPCQPEMDAELSKQPENEAHKCQQNSDVEYAKKFVGKAIVARLKKEDASFQNDQELQNISLECDIDFSNLLTFESPQGNDKSEYQESSESKTTHFSPTHSTDMVSSPSFRQQSMESVCLAQDSTSDEKKSRANLGIFPVEESETTSNGDIVESESKTRKSYSQIHSPLSNSMRISGVIDKETGTQSECNDQKIDSNCQNEASESEEFVNQGSLLEMKNNDETAKRGIPATESISCEIPACSSELNVSVSSNDSFGSLFQTPTPTATLNLDNSSLQLPSSISPFFDAFGHIEMLSLPNSDSKGDCDEEGELKESPNLFGNSSTLNNHSSLLCNGFASGPQDAQPIEPDTEGTTLGKSSAEEWNR